MAWTEREIFVATIEDPGHEFVFEGKYASVQLNNSNFLVWDLTRIITKLTLVSNKTYLSVRGFIGEHEVIGASCSTTGKIQFYQNLNEDGLPLPSYGVNLLDV
jgi:hypothetical protein